MKRKTIYLLIVLLLLVMIAFTACNASEKEILHKEPLDTRFTEAHMHQNVWYTYVYSGQVLIPIPHFNYVHVDDKYEVQFMITFVDETVKTRWEEVSKEEYDNICKILGESNDIQ